MDRASCDKLMLEEGRTKMEDNLNYLVCDNAKADRKRRGKATGMCAGDSGGPLTIQEDGVFYQIGTVSGYSQDGGSELCGENSAFYGSVAHHSKWINNILANKVAPNLDYEVVDVSIEGRMYKVMKQSKKGEWSMMGLTNGTFLEVEKMPSKFLIYTYRDNEFIKYNEYSGDIKIHRIEGFWFSKR